MAPRIDHEICTAQASLVGCWFWPPCSDDKWFEIRDSFWNLEFSFEFLALVQQWLIGHKIQWHSHLKCFISFRSFRSQKFKFLTQFFHRFFLPHIVQGKHLRELQFASQRIHATGLQAMQLKSVLCFFSFSSLVLPQKPMKKSPWQGPCCCGSVAEAASNSDPRQNLPTRLTTRHQADQARGAGDKKQSWENGNFWQSGMFLSVCHFSGGWDVQVVFMVWVAWVLMFWLFWWLRPFALLLKWNFWDIWVISVPCVIWVVLVSLGRSFLQYIPCTSTNPIAVWILG